MATDKAERAAPGTIFRRLGVGEQVREGDLYWDSEDVAEPVRGIITNGDDGSRMTTKVRRKTGWFPVPTPTMTTVVGPDEKILRMILDPNRQFGAVMNSVIQNPSTGVLRGGEMGDAKWFAEDAAKRTEAIIVKMNTYSYEPGDL